MVSEIYDGSTVSRDTPRILSLAASLSGVKAVFTHPLALKLFLIRARWKNKQKYRIPSYLRFKTSVTHRIFQGMQVFTLSTSHPQRIVLYLHGGAYVSQPSAIHWQFLDRLAHRTNSMIVVPLYPKIPHHTYREAIGPLINIAQHMLELTVPCRFTLMGDSAGGGLALTIAQALRDQEIEGPANIVMISPWLDMSVKNPKVRDYENVDVFLGRYGLTQLGLLWADGDSLELPMLSPIDANLEGLGRMTVVIGANEILLPDCQKLASRALAAGNPVEYFEYPGMFHVFPLIPFLPEAKQAFQQIVTATIR